MKSRSIFGIFLIILGIGFFMGQFEIWNFSDVIHTWWPVLIMLLGLFKISTDRNSIFFGIFLFLIGALLQAHNLDMLPWGFWNSLWPLMLILFGFWLISGRHKKSESGKVKSEDSLNEFLIFSGTEQVITSKNFTGGSVSVVFGGAEIDLTQANITGESAYLELNVVFGGIDLRVPQHWKIEISGLPFLGGMENKTRPSYDFVETRPVLKIKYTAIFGGIDIKN